MCLSILAQKFVSFELIGEYIHLSFDKGRVSVREVYDLFFRVSANWKNPRFTCISPNFLVADKKVQVTAVSAPGIGGNDDLVYQSPVGFGANFSPSEHSFSVRVIDQSNIMIPQTIEISGEVVVPDVVIDQKLCRDPFAVTVMESCGTVFELRLPPLKANYVYAMRLIVEPVEVLGLPSPRNLDEALQGSVRPYWIQDATVKCPKNCRFDYEKMLANTRERIPSVATSVGSIEAMVSDNRLTIAQMRRTRVVLSWPSGCDLYREQSQGCITSLGSPTSTNGRTFQEYYGGAAGYWSDDVWALGLGIWKYLSEVAPSEPKSKDSITTALGVQRENCNLLVDKMVQSHLIEVVNRGNGLYKASDIAKDKLLRALDKMATNPRVNGEFVWTGYRILFAVKYTYLSDEDKLRLKRGETQAKLAFWLSLLGVLVGLAALIWNFVQVFL